MKIENDIKLDFDDVLIKPKRTDLSSRSEVDLKRHYKFKHSNQTLDCVGLIAANMDTIGTISMAEELAKYDVLTCLHKFHPAEELIRFFNDNAASKFAFYTLGISDEDVTKLKNVSRYTKINKICVDVANAYQSTFVNKLKSIRYAFPDAIIMAGNICTSEMTQELIISGEADIIKAGTGGGGTCLTRIVTGVGYPQLSMVLENADAAHGLGGHICSDGGCKSPGDVVKAFGGGADFVMLGSMLSGHKECSGTWIEENGQKYLKYYGMSSREAMEKYSGGLAEYRSSEGDCILVPYKGMVSETIKHILGGLRSACTYVGARNLKDLPKCTTFLRVNRIK